ncbi:hypothetical protein WAI453_009773 [Rhynchosporium graminicola]
MMPRYLCRPRTAPRSRSSVTSSGANAVLHQTDVTDWGQLDKTFTTAIEHCRGVGRRPKARLSASLRGAGFEGEVTWGEYWEVTLGLFVRHWLSYGDEVDTLDVGYVAAVDSGIWDLGSGIWDLGSGIWDLGSGIWDLGSGIWDLGSGIWDLGSGIWDLGSGIWDLGSGIWDLGSGIWGSVEMQEKQIEKPYLNALCCAVSCRDSLPLESRMLEHNGFPCIF